MRLYVYTLFLDDDAGHSIMMCSPEPFNEVIDDQIGSFVPFIKLINLDGVVCYVNVEHIIWYARNYEAESCQDEQTSQSYEYDIDEKVRAEYAWRFERISNALEHNTKLHKEYYGED